MSDVDWSYGYVTDAPYADRFHRELSPAWLDYVAALRGARPCKLDQFQYLELGCGFGTSSIVHAGAFPRAEFHACDFNAAHIEGGRRLAAALGIDNVHLHETSFESLPLHELPDFDFIVLHGVYSWVTPQVRATLRRILEAKTKPGGLVYVAYNCLPGWSVELPLRRLMMELAKASPGDSAARAREAASMLQQWAGLRYFEAHPEIAEALQAYVQSPGNYLAHEFLNEAWEPFYSVDVADDLAACGLSLLGSATLVDNHPELLLDGRGGRVVSQLEGPRLRHLAVDFALDRRFRRDVFVRGAPGAGPQEIARNIGAAVVGAIDPEQIAPSVKVPRGEVHFQPDFAREVAARMSEGSMPMGELVAALAGGRRDVREIGRNVMYMVAAGVLMPFAQATRGATMAASDTVARAMALIAEQGHPGVVPSEACGNGVPVTQEEAKAVVAFLREGAGLPADLASRLGRLAVLPGPKSFGIKSSADRSP